MREYKVLGSFHGFNFESGSTQQSEAKDKTKEAGIIPFGDPDEYKDLSDEDKQALTAKMLGPLYEWSKDPMGKTKHIK